MKKLSFFTALILFIFLSVNLLGSVEFIFNNKSNSLALDENRLQGVVESALADVLTRGISQVFSHSLNGIHYEGHEFK